MATTPEGKVKQKISNVLRNTPGLYYFMPVPGGFGQSTVDYIGCYCGLFFAIEAKKPGGKPTQRQTQIMNAMEKAWGKVFVIDGDTTELEAWLSRVFENVNARP